MTARTEILRRIAEALADSPASPDVVRSYRTTTPPDLDVVALFEERVADYRATVRTTSAGSLPDAIATLLAARDARRVAVPPGLDRAWLSAARVELVVDDPPLTHAELDALDGVVTACAVAIAETGTIVLSHGPDQGRRAITLLPDYHLCVVLSSQIVGDVPEALTRLDPRRALTWISGPSATSDIELQRVEGVHGPRNLEVIVVRGLDGGARLE